MSINRPKKNGTSKFKGVCWYAVNQKWVVSIYFEGTRKHVGCFTNEIDAAKAYNKSAMGLFGEGAYLNSFESEKIQSDGTRQIPLTQGKFAVVDDCDYEYLVQWQWYFDRYAVRSTHNTPAKEYMHSVILSRKLGSLDFGLTDHENGNRLDNRRSNLRPTTEVQNCWNSSPRKDETSRFKGVSRDTNRQKWRAVIKVAGKQKHLGYFTDEIEAAKVYNSVALKYFGEFAHLNIFEDHACLDSQ